MRKGDIIVITQGPPDKVGRIGEITTIMGNGAMVKLDKDHFTPIQFTHMERLYKCFKCKKLKRDYELAPISQDLVNNNKIKMNHNICKKCEEAMRKEIKLDI